MKHYEENFQEAIKICNRFLTEGKSSTEIFRYFSVLGYDIYFCTTLIVFTKMKLSSKDK